MVFVAYNWTLWTEASDDKHQPVRLMLQFYVEHRHRPPLSMLGSTFKKIEGPKGKTTNAAGVRFYGYQAYANKIVILDDRFEFKTRDKQTIHCFYRFTYKPKPGTSYPCHNSEEDIKDILVKFQNKTLTLEDGLQS